MAAPDMTHAHTHTYSPVDFWCRIFNRAIAALTGLTGTYVVRAAKVSDLQTYTHTHTHTHTHTVRHWATYGL